MTEENQQPTARATSRSIGSNAKSRGAGTTTKRTGTTKSTAASKAGAKSASKSPAKRTTKITGSAARATSGGSGKLVIVESPAKAKTISKYLGRGYTVKASMGHVRDLPKSRLGVQVDDNFTPDYLVPRDKSKVVKELKDSVRDAGEVLLATDPDREGEAIAWHLIEATNATSKPIKRVVFHEITPEAVRSALQTPRDLDMHLVDAQQARRVLDRLVGYEISPLLWKNVKRGLSAGRVQSVALRLIVDREREIRAFNAVEYWSLEAELAKHEPKRKKPRSFVASLTRVNGEKPELNNEAQATAIVQGLEGAEYVVASVQTKETQRRPSAPFTTSTLQQEASRKLRFAVRRTMQLAQELYEGVELGKEGTQGLITYMRTDSTNIAASAQARARDVIAQRFGAEYLPERAPIYTRKSKGAQEAHEAIRPTDPARTPEMVKPFLSQYQHRLYTLIWQRFIASQMRNAIFDTTTVDIDAGKPGGERPYRFRATGSVPKFKGFILVYQEGRDDEEIDDLDRDALPPLEEKEALDLLQLMPEQHFTQPPPRFTEASLVKALEELGIGRPSTYAPTIATLEARYYVTKAERKLTPTELGEVVNDLLVEHFPDIVDVQFTSRMEDELDEIASGDRAWVPVMRDFYQPFHQKVEQAANQMTRVKVADEETDEVCEKCGRPMVIKLGRFGRFLACSGFPECRNAKPILEKIGVPCPQCGQGEIVVKRARKAIKGRSPIFYGCSRYPECDFTSSDKPTGERCPACGDLLVESGRGQVRCRNQQCGWRGRPLAEAS